jgi:hypothetical protein
MSNSTVNKIRQYGKAQVPQYKLETKNKQDIGKHTTELKYRTKQTLHLWWCRKRKSRWWWHPAHVHCMKKFLYRAQPPPWLLRAHRIGKFLHRLLCIWGTSTQVFAQSNTPPYPRSWNRTLPWKTPSVVGTSDDSNHTHLTPKSTVKSSLQRLTTTWKDSPANWSVVDLYSQQ